MSEVIAVYGGSFNPPHVAHLMSAVVVLGTHAVDELMIVPCFRHPFDKELAPFDDRMEMCRLAFADLPRVTVSPIEQEIDKGTPSRTLETLEALAARRPQAQLRLVIGADILGERHKWWRWDAVEKLAPPIVLGRQGYAAPPEFAPLVELPGISSTEVRARVKRGESIERLVPRRVVEYIMRKGSYRS